MGNLQKNDRDAPAAARRQVQPREGGVGRSAPGGAQGRPRVLRARCWPMIRNWMLMDGR
jgi:hypothetical protein